MVGLTNVTTEANGREAIESRATVYLATKSGVTTILPHLWEAVRFEAEQYRMVGSSITYRWFAGRYMDLLRDFTKSTGRDD